MTDKEQVIFGQVPSKSNSYRIIKTNGHSSLSKTPATRKYEQSFYMQCGRYREHMIDSYFKIDIDVYLPNMSHDIDNCAKVVWIACKAVRLSRMTTGVLTCTCVSS